MDIAPAAEITAADRQRIYDALVARAATHGVKVEAKSDAKRHGGGYYSRGDKKIGVTAESEHTDTGLSTLAHEVGHADFDQSMLGALVQDPYARAAASLAPGIGGLIAIVAEGSLARRMALSMGAAAALQVPLLTGEAVASVKGHQMLEEHGATQEQLDLHKRQMLEAFGTYASHSAKGVGLAGAFAGLAHFAPKDY